MPSLIADETLLNCLARFLEPMDIVDAQGNYLGQFQPARVRRASEADEREMEGWESEQTYPNADVLARFRLLEVETVRRKSAGQPDLTVEEAISFVDRLRDPWPPTSFAL